VEYLPRSESSSRKIVVLDRGFVVVGLVSFDGEYVVIDDCQCVRRWGTTAGLGELASNGPLENTKLDAQPRTVVHKLQVVQMIDCLEEKWKQ
jgi:hypothetical protein